MSKSKSKRPKAKRLPRHFFPRRITATMPSVKEEQDRWIRRAVKAPNAKEQPQPIGHIRLYCDEWDYYVVGASDECDQIVGYFIDKGDSLRYWYGFTGSWFVRWCRELGFDVHRDADWRPRPMLEIQAMHQRQIASKMLAKPTPSDAPCGRVERQTA